MAPRGLFSIVVVGSARYLSTGLAWLPGECLGVVVGSAWYLSTGLAWLPGECLVVVIGSAWYLSTDLAWLPGEVGSLLSCTSGTTDFSTV